MIRLLGRTRFHRDHRWTPRHISPYLEDEMPRRSRTRVRRHVAVCPECYRLLLTMRRMIGSLAHLSQLPASDTPDLVTGVRRRLSG